MIFAVRIQYLIPAIKGHFQKNSNLKAVKCNHSDNVLYQLMLSNWQSPGILDETHNRNQNIENLKTSENSTKTKKLEITKADTETETDNITETENIRSL